MDFEAWGKEVRLIAFIVNAALEDTFWELYLDEEEVRCDFERGLTPGQAVRDAMLDGLTESKKLKMGPTPDIHERLINVRNL